jgi:hypothetical protein
VKTLMKSLIVYTVKKGYHRRQSVLKSKSLVAVGAVATHVSKFVDRSY